MIVEIGRGVRSGTAGNRSNSLLQPPSFSYVVIYMMQNLPGTQDTFQALPEGHTVTASERRLCWTAEEHFQRLEDYWVSERGELRVISIIFFLQLVHRNSDSLSNKINTCVGRDLTDCGLLLLVPWNIFYCLTFSIIFIAILIVSVSSWFGEGGGGTARSLPVQCVPQRKGK